MDSVAVQSRKKRRAPFDSNSDLISNLPSDVVDNILICLPLKDAAKTSILSRKWRFKWLRIPKLVFNDDVYVRSYESPKEIWFLIYQILLLHNGPVRAVVLSLIPEMMHEICFIDQLIRCLSEKGIQEFSLCDAFKTKYRLPSTLFQCLQLTHLTIHDYTLRLPPQYNGFSKLIHLKLFWTEISASDFKTFISKCPVLQELLVEELNVDDNTIEIDARNLKLLEIYDFDGAILLKNVPVLSTFTIESCFGVVGSMPNIVSLSGSLPAIENFRVRQDSLTDLSGGIIPQMLPNTLDKLKFVELSGLNFNTPKQIKCALLLIRSSPNLERLEIKSHDEDVDNTSIFRYQEALSVIVDEDSFNHLQEVKMKKFKGTLPELEFLKVILNKSLVLKKIAIQHSNKIDKDERLRILESVVQLERASPKAKIVFMRGDESYRSTSIFSE